MVYLILKELAGSAEDIIMSTSIIMKDTSVASDVLYRATRFELSVVSLMYDLPLQTQSMSTSVLCTDILLFCEQATTCGKVLND